MVSFIDILAVPGKVGCNWRQEGWLVAQTGVERKRMKSAESSSRPRECPRGDAHDDLDEDTCFVTARRGRDSGFRFDSTSDCSPCCLGLLSLFSLPQCVASSLSPDILIAWSGVYLATLLRYPYNTRKQWLARLAILHSVQSIFADTHHRKRTALLRRLLAFH